MDGSGSAPLYLSSSTQSSFHFLTSQKKKKKKKEKGIVILSFLFVIEVWLLSICASAFRVVVVR